MNIKIGAQFFTIRDFCQTIEEFRTSCKRVSEMGYRYIQLSGTGDFSSSQIKNVLDEYSLKVVCTHRAPQNYIDCPEKEISFHKELDCNICGIGCMPAFNAKPETVEDFVKAYRPVAEKLKEHGLVFGYHNHAFEFKKTEGRTAFDLLYEKMDCDNFKLILDVYWLAYAGINPAKFIKTYKERIACVHFKDLKIVDNKSVFAEVGNGNLDWDDIISSCLESNVSYALVEQDICEGNPFDSLKTSYDFLHKKGLC